MRNPKISRILLAGIVLCLAVFAHAQDRRIVSVLDLTGEGISESELVALTNLLTSSIFDTGLVEVIDRSERQEILTEIEFSLSDCSDKQCAIEIGKILAANVIVIGSISQVGSRKAVDLKVIDVATSRVEGTVYDLYDSVDAIVDQIDVLGGQLMQNLTGEIAHKKEVLEYEDLVLLTVTSVNEGADVLINGASIGTIREGRISKAVNRGAEVIIIVRQEGFTSYELSVTADEETTVEVSLEPAHRLAVEAAVGMGAMGSLLVSFLPVPNWWFVSLGMGSTVVSLDPYLGSFSIILKGGRYFLSAQNRFRPYAGGVFLANLFKIYDFESIAFNDFENAGYLFGGIYAGLEFRVLSCFRLAVETSFYLLRDYESPHNLLQAGLVARLML